MRLKTREHVREPRIPLPSPEVPPAAGPCQESATATLEGSVFVQHGIHSGDYPIAGMTVAQARRTLAAIFNIDPRATAVLDGRRVPDEEGRVVTAADRILSFVKEAAAKGARAGRP